MITASNYFVKVKGMDLDSLPETLKKGHELVLKTTQNGSSWNNYNNNPNIKKVIDLYFEKLSEFDRITSKPAEKKKLPLKASAGKQVKTTRPIQYKAKPKPKASIKVREVEHIREEVKFIKRYVGLHNKMKSIANILSFIKSLQRSIVQKLIRKTSPLASEIEMIQDKLIQVYGKMKGDQTFVINDTDLNRLVGIAGGEQVYKSIGIIKRFIGLQGQSDENKIKAFSKYVENQLTKSNIRNDDPYLDKVKAIAKLIRNRSSSRITVNKAELNGLEGIVKAGGCKPSLGKIYNTSGKSLRKCRSKKYSDASRGACSHNKGLSGVLTAEEMANRELDLLQFTSFWFTLFGNPARNFTMMFHGEPHNGKTIFLLMLAQYLAENFGEVLYVSSEEFASPTMTAKVNQFLSPIPKRLHFAENLQDPELSQYKFIILDSVNDLGLKINDYKQIRKDNPETAFIFILQHTKAGDFKGGKDWEHTAEIVGEVAKGTVTITKNRYATKNYLDFFKQVGIEWEEPKTEPKLKPYAMADDMTTSDQQHI